MNIVRTEIWVTIPLVPVEQPDLDAYYLRLATFGFDTGFREGDQFEIQDWSFGQNRSVVINETAAIVKRTIQIIPSEQVSSGQKQDVFQISLYAEIADKEKLQEICMSMKALNPGKFVDSPVLRGG